MGADSETHHQTLTRTQGSAGREWQRIVGARGVKYIMRIWPIESPKQGSGAHRDWGGSHRASMHGSEWGPWHVFMVVWLGVLLGLIRVGVVEYFWVFCLMLDPFPPRFPCPALMINKGLCLALWQLVILCLFDIPGRPALFWGETEREQIWGRRETGS